MTIPKRENELRDDFLAIFKDMYTVREFFVMAHQDVRKSGYPDIAVHGYGYTTHWEFKHGTPNFSSPVIQELTCCRIAERAHCRYIVFHERSRLQSITSSIDIFTPAAISGHKGKIDACGTPQHRIRSIVQDGITCFDFEGLAKFINNSHRVDLDVNL